MEMANLTQICSKVILIMKFAALLYFFHLLSTAPLFGQTLREAPAVFPHEWVGTWTGTLNIYTAKGLTDSVPMYLEIYPIDSSTTERYVFGLTYGSKEKDWRPYELVPVDPGNGLWQVDEKNGIVMESFFYGPKFVSWFSVMGSHLLCTYERRDEEEILFEVYAGGDTPVSTTGNTERGGERIPEVRTYPLRVFQRAVLRKQL